MRLRFRTFAVRSCCDMSNTRELPEVAKISFQNRTDNLKVELLVIVHGDIAESNHGARKGRCLLLFSVSAVVVWRDGEQTNEIAVAECRYPA